MESLTNLYGPKAQVHFTKDFLKCITYHPRPSSQLELYAVTWQQLIWADWSPSIPIHQWLAAYTPPPPHTHTHTHTTLPQRVSPPLIPNPAHLLFSCIKENNTLHSCQNIASDHTTTKPPLHYIAAGTRPPPGEACMEACVWVPGGWRVD